MSVTVEPMEGVTYTFDMNDRLFFQKLDGRASLAAKNVPNPSWKRAYWDLAHAANVLDAMIARTVVCDNEPESEVFDEKNIT